MVGATNSKHPVTEHCFLPSGCTTELCIDGGRECIECIGIGREIHDQTGMEALALMEEAWVMKSILELIGLEGKTVMAMKTAAKLNSAAADEN